MEGAEQRRVVDLALLAGRCVSESSHNEGLGGLGGGFRSVKRSLCEPILTRQPCGPLKRLIRPSTGSLCDWVVARRPSYMKNNPPVT